MQCWGTLTCQTRGVPFDRSAVKRLHAIHATKVRATAAVRFGRLLLEGLLTARTREVHHLADGEEFEERPQQGAAEEALFLKATASGAGFDCPASSTDGARQTVSEQIQRHNARVAASRLPSTQSSNFTHTALCESNKI